MLTAIKTLIAGLPLKKIGIALIIAALLLIAGLFINLRIVNNRNAKLKADNDRLTANQVQLYSQNLSVTKQVLRYKELAGELKSQVEKLADSLRIKPKQIIKIEYRTITEYDTVPVLVDVNPIQKNEWLIADTGKCHIWRGIAKLELDSLIVKRTEYSNENELEEAFYRKRPHKFLFIKWGKWVNYHDVKPTCGEAKVEQFEFIK